MSHLEACTGRKMRIIIRNIWKTICATQGKVKSIENIFVADVIGRITSAKTVFRKCVFLNSFFNLFKIRIWFYET